MCGLFIFESTMLYKFQETLFQIQWLPGLFLMSRADDELPAQYNGL